MRPEDPLPPHEVFFAAAFFFAQFAVYLSYALHGLGCIGCLVWIDRVILFLQGG